jgi:hypothetical protein
MDLLRKIMSTSNKAEVFLTLAVDHIAAHVQSAGEAWAKVRSALRIEPALEGYFTGARSMEEAQGMSNEERTALMLGIQRYLHDAFALKAGAPCYTPFFITSAGSHRSYWFLHLAHSARANDVVKALHWKESNHFEHFGRAGTVMLGFDPRRPPTSQLAFNFGESAREQTVRALVEELPERIVREFSEPIALRDLYGKLCSETPADMDILGEAINRLCVEQFLEKVGAHGEERELRTKVDGSDLIGLAKQPGLFARRLPKR